VQWAEVLNVGGCMNGEIARMRDAGGFDDHSLIALAVG